MSVEHELAPGFRASCKLFAARAVLLALALSVSACLNATNKLSSKDASMVSPAEKELLRLEDRGIIADPYRPGRRVTMSRHGIVATSHILASQAGLDILRAGGNAADAAIAAGATLAVVEPMMTGLGGDVWVLYYEAKTGKVYALNGSGHSPVSLTREYFEQKKAKKIDGNSWEAVTVPGAVDAYFALNKKFGSKPMPEILAPSIRYAEEGFPVAEVVGAVWKSSEKSLLKDKACRETYLVGDKAPAISSVFKSPKLGKSLRLIAEGGRDAYYKGPIAQEIVRYAKETNGFFSMEDFASHHSNWVEPLTVNYRGYDVYQCPPNGQGMGVLMMLNILEGYDLSKMKYNSPEYLHLCIEAKKLAYADLYKFVGDPDKGSIPVKWLLSKEYAAERRKLIDPRHAAPTVDPGIPKGGDTIYLTTIDQEGNACSFINSMYAAFGSKIVGGETGILLQNRGDGFTLQKGHFNEYAPGKRPYHTIIPGMVLKDKKLYMSYGLMGGPMQPQGHVQFLLSHLDFGLTIQEAADVPRWRHMDGLKVLLEHGTPRATMDALRKMGHKIEPAGGGEFGGAQAILVDPKTGTYCGASDPRKDGAALGY